MSQEEGSARRHEERCSYVNEWITRVETLKCFNFRNNPSELRFEYSVTMLTSLTVT
jgi:hypothetical protein